MCRVMNPITVQLHIDSVDVSFNKRVMASDFLGWRVGATRMSTCFATDINVSNGNLAEGPSIGPLAVSRRLYSLFATLSDRFIDEDGCLSRNMTIRANLNDDSQLHDDAYHNSSRGTQLHLGPYQRDVTNVKRSGEWLNTESRIQGPLSGLILFFRFFQHVPFRRGRWWGCSRALRPQAAVKRHEDLP